MTVRELIAELQKVNNPELPVVIADDVGEKDIASIEEAAVKPFVVALFLEDGYREDEEDES